MKLRPSPRPHTFELTAREAEALEAKRLGFTGREMAALLDHSEGSIPALIQSAVDKERCAARWQLQMETQGRGTSLSVARGNIRMEGTR